MKAMILAAGRGERMRPLTDVTPKPLLEVRGKPLIQWHIEKLRAAGFDELVVNVSWLKESLIEFLRGNSFGVKISISEEPPGALETAGGIRKALAMLGEEFLVVNGDVWTDFDFSKIRTALRADALAHLVLVPNPPHHPAGDFVLRDSLVHSEAGQRHTFSGIGVYRRELFSALPQTAVKLAPVLREAMAQKKVTGELFAGHWSDIGTPERLTELNQL